MFPKKSGYFTELRCSNLTEPDSSDPDLCERCLHKSEKPFRTGCQQGQYQGKIDEPYYEGSWIFGSERFLKMNGQPGNSLSNEEFARAESAQKIARQGSEMKLKISEGEKSKDKDKDKDKDNDKNKNKTKPKEKPQEKPQENKEKLKPKPSQTNTTSSPMPLGVELLDDPLEAVEVVKIRLNRLNFKSNEYWIEQENSSLFAYDSSKKNKLGKRIGILNTDEETIEP